MRNLLNEGEGEAGGNHIMEVVWKLIYLKYAQSAFFQVAPQLTDILPVSQIKEINQLTYL